MNQPVRRDDQKGVGLPSQRAGNQLFRAATLALVSIFIASGFGGCGSDSSNGTPAVQRPTSPVIVDVAPGAFNRAFVRIVHREAPPFPDGTATLRITESRIGRGALFPPVIQAAAQTITIAGVPAGRGIVQIDYLAADGTVVGDVRHGIDPDPGHTAVIHNPAWVSLPLDFEPPGDHLGRFGAEDHLVELSPTNPNGPAVFATASASPSPSPSPCTLAGCWTLPAFTKGPRALPPVADIRSPYFADTSFQLPPATTLENLPVPRAQGTSTDHGSPGSCISWSFAYGMGSYTAARNPDGTVKYDITATTDAPDQISSAFMYNLVHSLENACCPTGSGAGYTEYLTLVGAPSYEQVPYHPNCEYLAGIDCSQTFSNASQFQIGFSASVNLAVPSDARSDTRQLLKSLMVDNHAVAFAGPVFESFAAMGPADAPAEWWTNGVWYPENGVISGSGHGQMVVGYDDSAGSTASPGAFLIQNSFGTAWPPQAFTDPVISPAPPGRYFIDYGNWSSTQLNAGVAWPPDLTVPTSGTMLAANAPGAPASYVTHSYQYVGPIVGVTSTDSAFLILTHWFSQPVTVTSVALREPEVQGQGGSTIKQTNAFAMHDGYTYFVRLDGNSWLNGIYPVTVQARTNDGTPFTWTGAVSVGAPDPAFPQLTPAPMPLQPARVLGDLLTPGSAVVTSQPTGRQDP